MKETSINGNNTGYKDGGVYYYVKMLDVNDDSKLYYLEFEGVYCNTSIYVNGQYCGQNNYGYNKFSVDINDYLKFDEQNEIRVIVKNDNQNSRWYAGGGIYRNVNLITKDHIALNKPVKITTLKCDDYVATINFQGEIKNYSTKKEEVNVKIQVSDDEYIDFPVIIFKNKVKTFNKSISIKNPKLWDEYNPYLYNIKVSVGNERYYDEEQYRFGIRDIQINEVEGFKVNGKKSKLLGACIHHDSGILGTATYYDYEYYKIKKMKDAGFNSIRMSHNPMSQQMLEVCDELGMYVMNETFDMWTRSKTDFDFSKNFDSDYLKEVELMVETSYNHPCVIMYSLGNEIPEVATDSGTEILDKMNKVVKDLDPLRYTLCSINGVFSSGDDIGQIMQDVLHKNGDFSGNVNNFMQVMDMYMNDIVTHDIVSKNLEKSIFNTDICGYNYMTSRYDLDQDKHKIIVGSETYPPEIYRNYQKMQEYSNVIGDFTWTGWDYIGEAGVGIPAYNPGEGGFGAQYPARLAYCGDFTLIGDRRPLSYYRELVFNKTTKPYISVINPYENSEKMIKTPWVLSDSNRNYTYDYNGYVQVEVYNNADKVELFLDGEIIDTQDTINNIALFKFKYKKGILVAKAIKNNIVIGKDELKSVIHESSLDIEIKSGLNNELIFVEITQKENETIDYKEEELVIQSANSDLLAVGTGNPKDTNNYTNNHCITYQGKALAIFKYNDELTFTINNKVYNIKELT